MRWKWPVAFIWVLIALGAFTFAGSVNDVESDDVRVWLPASAGSTRALDLAGTFPGTEPEHLIVVYARAAGLTPADRAAAEADQTALGGQLVPSADGQALMLLAPFEAATDDSAALELAEARQTVTGGLPAGLDARLTGGPATDADFEQAFDSLDTTLLIVTVGVVALLLLLTYRSPILLFIPLLCAGVASVLSGALVYWAAKQLGLVVDPQSAGILTVLVFGPGTDYAMLLIARYREELRHHADRHAAMAQALRRSLPAIAASAATVILALLTLMFADLNSTRGLGPVAALGIASALTVMTTLLPALLTICGRWAFWPAIPHPTTTPPPSHPLAAAPSPHQSLAPATSRDTVSSRGASGDARPDADGNGGGTNVEGGSAAKAGSMAAHGFWGKAAGFVERRPRAIWVSTALVLAAMALGSASLTTGLQQADSFISKPDSLRGFELLAAHFPAGSSDPAEVYVPNASAEKTSAMLGQLPGVDHVEESTQSGQWTRIPVILADDPASAAGEEAVLRIREAVATVDPATVVGGSTAQLLDQDSAMDRDLKLVIPLILLVVLIVLIVLLRSLVAPLLLLASVVLSFGAALGLSAGIYHLIGFPTLDKTVLLNGFLFLVALGVDYTIFLMTRAREEAAVIGHRQGVIRALAVTGGVITSAGIVLAATFAVLSVMPIVFMVQLGVLVAAGVLLDTFVVRSLLVPALILDTGPISWWPGRLASQRGSDRGNTQARRALQRLGARGGL
jgi:RND superfamily putative drug exporter